jgi:hypothetical protein
MNERLRAGLRRQLRDPAQDLDVRLADILALGQPDERLAGAQVPTVWLEASDHDRATCSPASR